jgi:hemolysin activation/secretion protein
LQTIRIVITSGKVQSVEIREARKPKTLKEIAALLRTMPKDMLADALGMKQKERRVARE